MTTKLTPDQLHRLIDEVAELAYEDHQTFMGLLSTICAENCVYPWWNSRGRSAYISGGRRYAGLSAVLILLSEGG